MTNAVGPASSVDKQRAIATAESSLHDLVSMLESVRRVDARAVGQWTVRDVAAHLAVGAGVYAGILRGEGSPVPALDSVATFNSEAVREHRDRDFQVLTQEVAQRARELCETMRAAPDRPVEWHGGLRLPLSTACCVLAGEALVHGRDVARAAGKAWSIGGDRARTVLVGLQPVIPHYVDVERAAEVRACYDLRLRGGERPRTFFVFDRGSVSVERPSDRPVDCRIWADPVAFLLVAYGRMGPWPPTLQGKILAAGRKPWLALRLSELLKKP